MNKIQKSIVEIDDSAFIFDNVTFIGKCKVGANSTIYPNSIIIDSEIGENCVVFCSVIENSNINSGSTIGPFAHIRPNSVIGSNCKIGNFVEIKNSNINDETKISHLAYVGDALVGKRCNIGCGVIFVNYNGKIKQRIVVEDDCFVGSNCNLIAPLTLARNSYICAGTTVTDSTNPFDFVIGRERAIIKPGRAKKYWREDD